MAPIDDLAAALNNRSITDEKGEIIEENDTPQEEPAASEEKTTEEGVAQAEKPAESEDEAPKPKSEEDEINMVELATDDSGKRYVPESRFKEVYAKMKDFERSLNEKPKEKDLPLPKIETKPLDKTDQVEVELLRATLPQFNPESPDYSQELDELGYAIYKATPGITRLVAARQAIVMAKKIQSKVAKVNEEARAEKSIQSDQGITSRVTSREPVSDVPGEDASPEEIEKYLRAHGQW